MLAVLLFCIRLLFRIKVNLHSHIMYKVATLYRICPARNKVTVIVSLICTTQVILSNTWSMFLYLETR
jgi:hypothetical protein